MYLAPGSNYMADVSGTPSHVEFQLGGRTVSDTNGADGWSALFDMSALSSAGNLTVKAFEGVSQADSYVHPVDLVMLPDWMRQSKELWRVSRKDSSCRFRICMYNVVDSMVGRRGASMLAQFVPPTASRRPDSDWAVSLGAGEFLRGGISAERQARPGQGWN